MTVERRCRRFDAEGMDVAIARGAGYGSLTPRDSGCPATAPMRPANHANREVF